MNSYDFYKEIETKFNEMYGEDAKAVYTEVSKNNGVILHGLNIRSEETNVSPTVYLDHFYELYEDGLISLEEVLEKVTEIYEDNKLTEPIDIEFLTDYEIVKDRIEMKIIGRERNMDLLEEVPYVPFLDLAIVFYVRVENEFMGTGSILVKESMKDAWGIDDDELLKVALTNVKSNNPIEFTHIYTVLSSMVPEDKRDDVKGIFDDRNVPMYVASNSEKIWGATAILFDNELGNFADKLKEDLIILPCSIHEIIVLPARDADIDSLKQIVVEINNTQLGRDIILSDSVYYFNRENRRVSRVA